MTAKPFIIMAYGMGRTSLVRYVTDSMYDYRADNTNSDTKQMLVKDIERILMGEENIPADELSKATLIEDSEAAEEDVN